MCHDPRLTPNRDTVFRTTSDLKLTLWYGMTLRLDISNQYLKKSETKTEVKTAIVYAEARLTV